MSTAPRSTFSQLLLLLGCSIAVVLAVSAWVLRRQALAGGIEHVQPMLELQIELIESALAGRSLQQTPFWPVFAARLRASTQVPAASETTLYPFAQALSVAMTQSRGADAIRLQHGDPPQLWIRLRTGAEPRWWVWPVPVQLQRVTSSTILILLGAALVVFVAAAWWARRQSRALRWLAAQAPALSRGEHIALSDRAPSSREVQALHQALWAAAAEVRTHNQLRSQTLAGISHDLRTPLARLRFALELETEGAGRDAMIADVEEMDALIAQFIAYARDGEAEADAVLDLGRVLHGLVAQRRRMAQWSIDVTELWVQLKPLGLRRAVGNLLDNAEKHGLAPWSLTVEAAPAGSIRIVVGDAGPGVPDADQARVLRAFERGSSARSAEVPGSGLGLAMVARFAHDCGGLVSMRSVERAEGRRFEVVLELPASVRRKAA